MSINRRHKYFVHRGIQFSLIARMVLQCILFAICCCALTAITQMMLNPLADHAERALQLKLTTTSIVIASICLMPVFIWDSIKFSHRFVGPILRLHSIVKRQMGPGDRIRLRKGDFWTDLAADYNRMLERAATQQEGRAQTNEIHESDTFSDDELSTHEVAGKS